MALRNSVRRSVASLFKPSYRRGELDKPASFRIPAGRTVESLFRLSYREAVLDKLAADWVSVRRDAVSSFRAPHRHSRRRIDTQDDGSISQGGYRDRGASQATLLALLFRPPRFLIFRLDSQGGALG
jgi:hypothetical protein